jgi:hypothetical protein
VAVIQNFLGNKKADDYEELITGLRLAYRNLGCNMSVHCSISILVTLINFPRILGLLVMNRTGWALTPGSHDDGNLLSGAMGHKYDGMTIVGASHEITMRKSTNAKATNAKATNANSCLIRIYFNF